MSELAERIARAWQETYDRRDRDREGTGTTEEAFLEGVVAELLERGVIAAGVPAGRGDPEWRRAYGRVEGDEGLGLLREFHEQAMGWLANRVLHPFGWALGLVVDEDGAAVGLGVQKTSDPEGVVNPLHTELDARRRFLERAQGRELPPAEPPAGVLPTACPLCGRPRYRRTVGRVPGELSADLPPAAEDVTYVQPHELAGAVIRLACGNPRCRAYEPMRRG